ncbi:MAG TPA: SDR family oxidoreductase [Chloroflexota bacterium]
MDLGLAGKVAIVTGGSSGIGLATARMFLDEGARVAICARGEERLRDAQRTLGDIYAEVCDVTGGDAVRRFVDGVAAHFGGVDVLVNNAGGSRFATFQETTEQAWRDELELKYFSLFHSIHAVLPHMTPRGGGRIVNVNAILARQPEPHLVATAAARAGALNLSHSLAVELAPHSILVNTVLLGAIESEQWRRRYHEAKTRQPLHDWLVDIARARGVALGRFGQPDEVAAAIVFLCSRQASFITGATLDIGGGVSRYV